MRQKKRTPSEIINDIAILLDELSSLLGKSVKGSKKSSLGKISVKNEEKKYSGVAGGIQMLIVDNFFQEPKPLSEVVARLRQEGFNYRRSVIAMALLRAVRNRSLTRLEAENRKGKEKWIYAKRK